MSLHINIPLNLQAKLRNKAIKEKLPLDNYIEMLLELALQIIADRDETADPTK